MKLNNLLPARDLSIKEKILDLVSPEQAQEMSALLDKGFSEGNEVWNRVHIPNLFGEEGAKRYHKILDTELTPQ